MVSRVVVVGGGVGGTLVANLLAAELKGDVHVTVVDPTGMHVYQPGFLYLALGEANGRWLSRDERLLLRPEVSLLVDRAIHIDPEGIVHLGSGELIEFDHLVLATGAQVVPELIPGMVEGAEHFYTLEGATRLREKLRAFEGGRVVLGVAGIPYKCPPAPIEFALMLEHHLRKRGLRERTEINFLSPLNRAFTIESASRLVQPIMEERGIILSTFFNVEAVDPEARSVLSLEGEKADYDLLILVPPHKGADVLEESNLTGPGGWVPTDRYSLQHQGHDTIYVLGDATDLPISKSGSTAHFEAPVIASRIASRIRGTAPDRNYGGRVMCFLETGEGKATALRFDYEHPPVPPKPSRIWHSAKWMFNRMYWSTVPMGRIPEWIGAPGKGPPT